jgi:hypothetical protein
MPAGRPTAYKPEFIEQAEKLCSLGATDIELADFFGVSVRTLGDWKIVHPEFLQAIRSSKEAADNRVERSLYQKALGYQQDAVKIFMPANAEKPVYAPYREHVAPDTTACIFWLKNRRSQEWRDDSNSVNVQIALPAGLQCLFEDDGKTLDMKQLTDTSTSTSAALPAQAIDIKA